MAGFEQSQHTEQTLAAVASRLQEIEGRTGLRIAIQYGEPASERTWTELFDFDLILCLSQAAERGPHSWSLHFLPAPDLEKRDLRLPFEPDHLEARIRVLGRRLAADLKQTSATLALKRFLEGLDKNLTP